MTEAEAKDAILEFLLDKEEESTFSAYSIDESNILEDNPLGTIEVLINKIGRADPEVAHVTIAETGCFIRKNNFTSVFIEQGGFTRYELDASNQKRKQEEREQLEIDLAKSNLEAIELNKQIAERNRKHQRSNKIATWINVGIGIINLVAIAWQLYKAG